MKEALLYKKLKDDIVQCGLCNHRCVILPNKRGICGVRENQNGKLYSLVYRKAIALNVDPIEKKPFFHFFPGSQSLSIATVGCNFRCANCQNWGISQSPKLKDGEISGRNLPPEKIVQDALDNNCKSIAYTYTEPTIFFEYALETMKLAYESGLKNVWVSNGFMSKEAIETIAPYLDAINVDLKSFSDDFYRKICKARLAPVLENLKQIKKLGIWLEVTTLVIPTLSDDEKMFKDIAMFIKKELGSETPWHVTQFSGLISWKLQHLSETPIGTLEKVCQIGLNAGLKYVYSGNVPGLASEDTYCPRCKELMIDRDGYQIIRFDKNGYCINCGEDLNIIDN